MTIDKRNLWFDLIRGLSALLVCMGHLRNALFIDFSDISQPTVFMKAFYLLTSFGHEAVMIFFVLSGYFVGGAVLRAGKQFSWQHYLISRLTRLWMVLVPSLVLTFFVSVYLAYYFPQVLSGAYSASWHSGPKAGEYSMSTSTLVANLLFLQTIIAPVYGVNSPLWSLANEFWYYLIFPLLLSAFGLIGVKKSITQFFAVSFLLVILFNLPDAMLSGFLIWLLGAGVYLLQSKVKKLSTPTSAYGLIAALILFFCMLMMSKSQLAEHVNPFIIDFLIGLFFACLCLTLINNAFPQKRFKWLARFSLMTSEISYSLYLSHFPFVLLIAAGFYGAQKMPIVGILLMQFLCWIALLLGIAGVMWFLFESRTKRFQNKLENIVYCIKKSAG
jgi:peptidoglycan/LPS O-acetylase OafA/YrhL